MTTPWEEHILRQNKITTAQKKYVLRQDIMYDGSNQNNNNPEEEKFNLFKYHPLHRTGNRLDRRQLMIQHGNAIPYFDVIVTPLLASYNTSDIFEYFGYNEIEGIRIALGNYLQDEINCNMYSADDFDVNTLTTFSIIDGFSENFRRVLYNQNDIKPNTIKNLDRMTLHNKGPMMNPEFDYYKSLYYFKLDSDRNTSIDNIKKCAELFRHLYSPNHCGKCHGKRKIIGICEQECIDYYNSCFNSKKIYIEEQLKPENRNKYIIEAEERKAKELIRIEAERKVQENIKKQKEEEHRKREEENAARLLEKKEKELNEQLAKLKEDKKKLAPATLKRNIENLKKYDQDVCGICLCDYEQDKLSDYKYIHKYDCGHCYHSECKNSWEKSSHKTSCPMCKK